LSLSLSLSPVSKEFHDGISTLPSPDFRPLIDGMHSFLLIVASLLSLASAKICKPVTIPVDIEVRNGVFNITAPQSNLDVTLFAQNSARQGRNYSDVILTGYATVKKSIVIAGMYCTPNKGTSSKNAGTVQVLTHGIGFDKGFVLCPLLSTSISAFMNFGDG
jgi:hypothetical protein